MHPYPYNINRLLVSFDMVYRYLLSLKFSPSCSVLLTTSGDNIAKLWSIPDGAYLKSFVVPLTYQPVGCIVLIWSTGAPEMGLGLCFYL